VDPALAAAVSAAEACGIPSTALVRQSAGSTSAVFAAGDLVFIVAGAYADPATLTARVAIAAVLSRSGRFVRPVWPEPRSYADRLVTAWERVHLRPGPVDWHSAGLAVRTLHDTPPGALRVPLPNVGDLADVRAAVDLATASGGLDPGGARLLRGVATRLDEELARLDDRRVVVHGDLHAPNVLGGRSGVLLCDTDEIALGAPGYDLGVLLDPGRPAIPFAGLTPFVQGYGAPLPSVAARRTYARSAHLRRTVALLSHPATTVHARFYRRVRLGAWAAMARDWERDLVPVVALPPGTRVRLARRAGR
jgi:hypothetical protein